MLLFYAHFAQKSTLAKNAGCSFHKIFLTRKIPVCWARALVAEIGVCMCLVGCLNWHILSLPCCCCCQGSRVFIATLGSVFHWKVLAWLELKSSQREETTHLLPSMMCFGCNRSTVPAVRSKASDKGSFHTRKNIL